jgi:hypothetical protein
MKPGTTRRGGGNGRDERDASDNTWIFGEQYGEARRGMRLGVADFGRDAGANGTGRMDDWTRVRNCP